MITQEQAKYLLGLPKEITKGGSNLSLVDEKIRLILVSPDDDEWEFLVDISNNKKKAFKISFHHQENNTNEGLLRIDYNGGHRNPETINDFVPDFLKPYVGQWFENEAHIHFFVESYKDLAWAMPLSAYKDFAIPNIETVEDYSKAVIEFGKHTNIITKFVLQQVIL